MAPTRKTSKSKATSFKVSAANKSKATSKHSKAVEKEIVDVPSTDSELESGSDEIESEVEESSEEENNDNTTSDESEDDDNNEEEADEEEAEESDEDDEDVEEALLAGLKGSDSEISESEDEDGEEAPKDEFSEGAAIISLDGERGQKLRERLRAIKKKPSSKPGVIFVGHIPHGFYEIQMLNYFKQFGRIKRLRISRNPRTGKSRHYAFIEFAQAEVAGIVAETMNNYLMFDRLLKCKVVPNDKVHPKMFMSRYKSADPNMRLRRQQAIHNRRRTQEQTNKRVSRLVGKEERKRKKLSEAGIDYDFPGYKRVKAPKAAHIKFTE